MTWGANAPYSTDVWDQSLSSKSIGPGTTLLLSTYVSDSFYPCSSLVRYLPVGPKELKIEFWDNSTGALATFASTAVIANYVAVQLEVTPLANKNDTN
jgi:hypothetical protein